MKRTNWDWAEIDSWRYDEKLSYTQIQVKTLEKYGKKISKGTLAYHYGVNQKEKTDLRKKKRIEKIGIDFYRFEKSVSRFKNRSRKQPIIVDFGILSPWDRFRNKVRKFRYKKEEEVTPMYTANDVKNYFWPDNTSRCGHEYPYIKCYLTGRIINVEDTTTHFDHINPKGGNGIDNLGFACKEANQAKSDLYLDDFYNLCDEILKYKNERSQKRGAVGSP